MQLPFHTPSARNLPFGVSSSTFNKPLSQLLAIFDFLLMNFKTTQALLSSKTWVDVLNLSLQ